MTAGGGNAVWRRAPYATGRYKIVRCITSPLYIILFLAVFAVFMVSVYFWRHLVVFGLAEKRELRSAWSLLTDFLVSIALTASFLLTGFGIYTQLINHINFSSSTADVVFGGLLVAKYPFTFRLAQQTDPTNTALQCAPPPIILDKDLQRYIEVMFSLNIVYQIEAQLLLTRFPDPSKIRQWERQLGSPLVRRNWYYTLPLLSPRAIDFVACYVIPHSLLYRGPHCRGTCRKSECSDSSGSTDSSLCTETAVSTLANDQDNDNDEKGEEDKSEEKDEDDAKGETKTKAKRERVTIENVVLAIIRKEEEDKKRKQCEEDDKEEDRCVHTWSEEDEADRKAAEAEHARIYGHENNTSNSFIHHALYGQYGRQRKWTFVPYGTCFARVASFAESIAVIVVIVTILLMILLTWYMTRYPESFVQPSGNDRTDRLAWWELYGKIAIGVPTAMTLLLIAYGLIVTFQTAISQIKDADNELIGSAQVEAYPFVLRMSKGINRLNKMLQRINGPPSALIDEGTRIMVEQQFGKGLLLSIQAQLIITPLPPPENVREWIQWFRFKTLVTLFHDRIDLLRMETRKFIIDSVLPYSRMYSPHS